MTSLYKQIGLILELNSTAQCPIVYPMYTVKAAVDSNEFESVNGDLSVEMNRNEVNLCPVELSTLK